MFKTKLTSYQIEKDMILGKKIIFTTLTAILLYDRLNDLNQNHKCLTQLNRNQK